MRQLASIQKIVDLQPIPDADKIEVATVLGWKCVVKKGEFEVGDLCVYFEIDSIVPDIPVFEFMRERKFRVRTIKLRKQISQGLALRIEEVLPIVSKELKEGHDVTELIGVTKYDPEAAKERRMQSKKEDKRHPIIKYMLQFKWFRRIYKRFSKKSGYNFPDFISKTDETRVQNIPHIFKQYHGTECYVTEKLDGQSATYAIYKKKFYVCSRNIHLHKTPYSSKNDYWKIAEMYDIENKLRNSGYKNIAIQTENCGPGIQKNKYKLDKLRPFVFNVKDLDTGKYLTQKEKDIFCNLVHLDHVPIIAYHYVLLDDMTVDTLVEFSKGRSAINADIHREGIVVRGIINDKFSFKCINTEFLLKYEKD